MMMSLVYTIGHSTRGAQELLALLLQHRVTAVADVRSQPYSRVAAHFNREALSKFLGENGIAYVFLGKELGARTSDRDCYVDGKLQYDRLARTLAFQEGLDRVERGSQKYSVALMCAEKDPLLCHRSILITRELVKRGISVRHIIDANVTEEHEISLGRLLSMLQMQEMRMFSQYELIELAYQKQGARIAYERNKIDDLTRRESA